MVLPNQNNSIFAKKNGQPNSLFKGSDSPQRPKERPTGSGATFQEQADDLLNCPTTSRAALSACRAENGREGLQKLDLTNTAGNEKGGSDSQITSEVASTAGGSGDAIKGMNADGDQINQMMDLAKTPELFQALKEHDANAAIDFAVKNTDFQQQAMTGMNDTTFQQQARLRLTGEQV